MAAYWQFRRVDGVDSEESGTICLQRAFEMCNFAILRFPLRTFRINLYFFPDLDKSLHGCLRHKGGGGYK